jgi:GNAT superfamily N-acetyltransferase
MTNQVASFGTSTTEVPISSDAGGRAAITYRTDATVTPDQLIDLYRATSLGARRPIDDAEIVADMIHHSNLLVTAWEGSLLVGVARSLSDRSYVAYLSDLAVRDSYQRLGIGRALVRRSLDQLGPRARLVLFAAPEAEEFYPRIGFERVDSGWMARPGQISGHCK